MPPRAGALRFALLTGRYLCGRKQFLPLFKNPRGTWGNEDAHPAVFHLKVVPGMEQIAEHPAAAGKVEPRLTVSEVERDVYRLLLAGAAVNELFIFDNDLLISPLLQGGGSQPHSPERRDVPRQPLIRILDAVDLQAGAQCSVRTILFDPLQSPLAAVVDRRDSRHGVEQGIHIVDVR